MVRILGDLVTLKDGWGPLLEGGVSSWMQDTMHLRREGLRNQCLGSSVGEEASWWSPGESWEAALWKSLGPSGLSQGWLRILVLPFILASDNKQTYAYNL